MDNVGTNDKPLLLAGIFTVVALLAALTGIVAWRSRRVALGLTGALGLVGFAAAAADRTPWCRHSRRSFRQLSRSS